MINQLLAKYVLRWLRANLGKKDFFSWFKDLQNIANEGLVYGNDKLMVQAEFNLIERLNQRIDVGPVVFDVGANVGSYSKSWLSYDANIHAFEPGEKAFALLEEKYGQTITANNIALAAHSGEHYLYQVKDDSRLASLLKRSHPNHTWVKSERVKCLSLDEYCESKRITEIDFLKIDVEGYEMEVLKGAETMLDNIKRIQFEFGGAHIEKGLYFRDFYNLLTPKFDLHYILIDGIEKIEVYDEKLENFKGANFLAVNKA